MEQGFAANRQNFMNILQRYRPNAMARILGDEKHSSINGTAAFYQLKQGVLVKISLTGLPTATNNCDDPILGLHIHEGTSCTGDAQDPFANAKTHYNPHNCEHPFHAGDLPPVFSADGTGFSVFLTARFTVKEIIGRVVILHAKADDFHTQPSGDSGMKIACGVIVPNMY